MDKMPVVKKMTCKFCGKQFDERENLPGLKVCELCDDIGKSGVAVRAKVYTRNVGGKTKEVAEVYYTAPGA